MKNEIERYYSNVMRGWKKVGKELDAIKKESREECPSHLGKSACPTAEINVGEIVCGTHRATAANKKAVEDYEKRKAGQMTA